MRIKKAIFICCLLLVLVSMASVSASDIDVQSSGSSLDDIVASDDVDVQSSGDLDDIVASDDVDVPDKAASSNENNVLNASFNDLQGIIDSTPEGGELNLSKDYSFSDGGDTLSINKSITINGNDHALSGSENARIFNIIKGGLSIVLKNITLEDGYSTEIGGAILNNYSSTSITLINCSFDSNQAIGYVEGIGGGGAIYTYGDLSIINSSFNENSFAYGYGGAIYCHGNLFVNNTSFDYNSVDIGIVESALMGGGTGNYIGADSNKHFTEIGGAIYCYGKCTIYNSEFHKNIAGANDNITKSYGGAIYSHGNLFIYNTSFLENNATVENGGAIYCEGNLYGDSLRFLYNKAYSGGAIYCEGETHINRSEFRENLHIENTTQKDYDWMSPTHLGPAEAVIASCGGAIYSVGKCYIDSCIFDGNVACEVGGAIFARSDLTITGQNSFTNNQVSRHFYFDINILAWRWIDKMGGAIYCNGTANINNASFSDNLAFVDGGAIYAEKKCSVNNCNFTNNSADGIELRSPSGGAIFSKGLLTVDNCSFKDNNADVSGGAIHAEAKSFIYNSKFKNNYAEAGIAVYDYGGAIRSKGSITIDNCSFEDNHNGNYGGAIYTEGNINVNHSSFSGNNARNIDGGAIYCEGDAIIDHSNFTNNNAEIDGGAVFSRGKTTIYNSKFNGNKANGSYFEKSCGGAVHSKGEVNVVNSSFESNHANRHGGAIYTDDYLTITGGNFSDNSADVDGGAVYVDKGAKIYDSTFSGNEATGKTTLESSYGGAVRANEFIEVQNSSFEDNFAYNLGGAIYSGGDTQMSNCGFQNNKANVDGGAVYSEEHTTIYNSRFKGNKATGETKAKSFGGAVRSNGEVSVQYSLFESNYAYNRGGAIYSDMDIIVENCNFTENEIDAEDGGAIYSDDDITITDSIFNGNSALGKSKNYKSYGGAVCSYGVVDVKKSKFIDNYAFNRGGAIFAFKEIKISDSNFTGNSANDYGGAIFTRTIKQKVANSAFNKNKATSGDGGAIYVNNSCNPEFASCTFEGDTASNRGGAIYMDSSTSYLKLNGCLFNNCSAKEGGAVYAHQLSSSITRCNFTNNKATSGDGGALYVKNNDLSNYSIVCEFVTCRFENNYAGNRGGAIFFGSKYSDLKVSYCTFVDNHADKKDYQGKNRRAGHSIFNMGNYKTIDMCWFGNNTPSFKEELVEYHTTGSDEDHAPSNYLNIYIKINDTDLYVGNPYKLTVYFKSTKGYGLSKDLMHSTGRFFGDGDFSNLYVDLNDMTASVILTKENPTISAQLDHQVVTLKLKAKTKDQTEINIISCEDAVYPDELKVIYEIIHGSGNEYYKIEDSYGNLVADGKITDPSTLSVSKLSPGDYTLTMYALETFTTLPCNVTKGFKVLKRPVSANVTVENVSYGTPSVIKVKADFDATYKVDVNGTMYDVVVKDGFGSKSISGLNAGDYYANVTLEDDNYILTPQNVLFTVNKADIDLVVVVFDELYDQDVEGIVYASVDGDYDLVVAGQVSVVTVINNLAYFNIGSGLEVGTYEANVSFDGNGNYNPAFNKTSFKIHQDIPSFEIEVSLDEFPYGQTAIVSHKLPDDASGTISYYLHDGTFLGELPISENLTLPILDMGFYGIIANYSGDHNYAPATDAVLILVDLAPNNANVTVENVTYGEESLIVVSADVDGVYQVDINGTVYNITVINGVGSKSIALDAGVYYANVTFDSWNYDTSSKNTVFEVYKASTNMHVLAYDIIYSQDLEGIIYSDVDGVYNLSIGDFSISVIVKDGYGEFNAGIFNAGYYTVIANYSGDANHKSNSSSIDIHIAKFIPTISLDIPEIDYGDVGVINITCDVAGSVNVTVNGITETLDLHGQRMKILFASLLNALSSNYDAGLDLYNLNAGAYPVIATYNGDDNYESPSLSGELKVNSVNADMGIDSNDISVGEDEKITVSLPSDATGNVTVTVDGKEYTAEVKDGKAVISISGLSAGNKEAKVSYSGDNNYNPVEDTVSFEVNKVKPNMTALSDDLIDEGDTLHIVVNLPKDATGNVTITIDGKSYTKAVKDGKVVFDISGLAPGKYDLKVYYSGDDRYLEDSDLLTVTVKENGHKHDNDTDNPKNKHSQNIDLASKVTGNPIFALILTLMTIGIIDIRRFKK